MIIVCVNCYKEFKVSPFRFAYGRKFCSKKCYSEHATKPIEERFWKYVQKTNSCWLWTGAMDANGYGTIRIKKKTHRSHVLSWSMKNGLLLPPKGMCVCHTCDNPSCVNPDHLFIGTRKDNTHDMVLKKRMRVGTLSPSDVYKIRELHALGHSYKDLAIDFKIHPQSIANIILEKSWKKLQDPPSLENTSM